MRPVPALALAMVLGLSTPAAASTVFSDNFDSETAALNYTGFANFSVTGAVDVVNSGSFGITCPVKCVDLDGSSSLAGTLTSLSSFAFNPGETIRLSFDLGGSQRVADGIDGWFAGFDFAGPTQMLNYGFNFAGSDLIVIADTTTGAVSTGTSIASTDPFATRSIFFTAGSAGSLTFRIGTTSADNVGPLLDNVSLDITGDAIPEPASWALMLAGFVMAGLALRRRGHEKRVSFA